MRDEPNLLIFYQDPDQGFAERPSQVCRLEDKPSLLWPAKLGRKAESLLVMTSDGVTELDFTDRSGPALRRQIITQQTILPESLERSSIAYFPLSPEVKGSAPVILVPVGRDLQVWRYADTWQHVQTLKDALETAIWASRDDLGYDRTAELTMSLGDITGDRRDDIIVRTSFLPMCRYAMYAQNQDGLFGADPTFDLVREVGLVVVRLGGHQSRRPRRSDQEHLARVSRGSYPGTLSGKVLVRVYTADEHGRIPAQPQQVFRKNDWIDSIPVVDVDGDGCLDLVLGYSNFDSREGFRKAFTAKQLDFKLRFHFYRPGEGFPEKPDCDVDLLVCLDHPSLDLTSPRGRYFETFVNLLGDFNGDGRRDLLVRDRADRISVYPFVSRQAGFAKTADVSFRYTDPIDRLQIADLNNDGISDLILKLSKKDVFRVFISRTR